MLPIWSFKGGVDSWTTTAFTTNLTINFNWRSVRGEQRDIHRRVGSQARKVDKMSSLGNTSRSQPFRHLLLNCPALATEVPGYACPAKSPVAIFINSLASICQVSCGTVALAGLSFAGRPAGAGAR